MHLIITGPSQANKRCLFSQGLDNWLVCLVPPTNVGNDLSSLLPISDTAGHPGLFDSLVISYGLNR